MTAPRRGRLAPSPTGAQHPGNARTYLLAYWSALAAGAEIVVRIEDIDSPRVKPWAAAQAVEDLSWLGIQWSGQPTVQTDHRDAYAAVIDRLRLENRVYPCTCSRKDIAAAASAPHQAHRAPIYPGTCAHWQHGDRLPEPGTYCWRFRVTDQPRAFHDKVLGHQEMCVSDQLGDFPVTQKSGDASYQLAVVVDDAAGGITEVVRGDDLVDSTFWQLEIYAALNRDPPSFAHVPLVVGPDGRRLAKRHGDSRLSELRKRGVASSEIVTWAAESSGLAMTNVHKKLGDLSPEELHMTFSQRFDWGDINRNQVTVPEAWTL